MIKIGSCACYINRKQNFQKVYIIGTAIKLLVNVSRVILNTPAKVPPAKNF